MTFDEHCDSVSWRAIPEPRGQARESRRVRRRHGHTDADAAPHARGRDARTPPPEGGRCARGAGPAELRADVGRHPIRFPLRRGAINYAFLSALCGAALIADPSPDYQTKREKSAQRPS